jgi:phage replication-related protein YjqB (UPF0714/DUF867 family)
LVLAPHAGGIEPGTSELAEAIAARTCSLYMFEGLKRTNNCDLHITSTHFDEPDCLIALGRSDTVLAIHGEDSDTSVTYIGGRDREGRETTSCSLHHEAQCRPRYRVNSNGTLGGSTSASITRKPEVA